MRVVAALLALVLAALPAPMRAQAPPSLVFEASPELSPVRARLEGDEVAALASMVRAVGLDDPGPPIRVVVAGALSAWAQMVPTWAAGFAIGEKSLVVLFPERALNYPHDTLADVLRHEVAHVLISRAAGGRPVPRWFHEGVAVLVERPWDVEDRTRLATALLFGPRLDLAAIEGLFLGDQDQQARAYLLSAAVVRHLVAAHGPDAPAAVLRQLAGGRPFDYAIASATAQSIPRFEQAFWDAQRTWTTWVPLAASSTALWLGVIALAALARRRRLRRSAELRAHWAEHEARDQEEGEPLFDTPTGDASLPARASQDDPTEPAAGRGR
jgi:hypothetical protein